MREGMQQRPAPAEPLLAARELQDPRATSGGGQRGPAPAAEPPARAGSAPLRLGCAFCLHAEDTQLRKHRRGHAGENRHVRGAGLGSGEAGPLASPERVRQELGWGPCCGRMGAGLRPQPRSRAGELFLPARSVSGAADVFFRGEFLIYELRDNWVQPEPPWLQLHSG